MIGLSTEVLEGVEKIEQFVRYLGHTQVAQIISQLSDQKATKNEQYMTYFVKLWDYLHIRSDLVTLVDINKTKDSDHFTVVVEAQGSENKRESFLCHCPTLHIAQQVQANVLNQLGLCYIPAHLGEVGVTKEEKATEKNLGFRIS